MQREVADIATSQHDRLIAMAVNRHLEHDEKRPLCVNDTIGHLTRELYPLEIERYFWDGELIITLMGVELVQSDDKNTLRIETLYEWPN